MGAVSACGEIARGCAPCSIEGAPQRAARPEAPAEAASPRGGVPPPAAPLDAGRRPGRTNVATSGLRANGPPPVDRGVGGAVLVLAPAAPPPAAASAAALPPPGAALVLAAPAPPAPALPTCPPEPKEALVPLGGARPPPWEGGLEEPEPAPETAEAEELEAELEVDEARERAKSAVAAAAVAGGWAAAYGTLGFFSTGFQEPQCPDGAAATAHLRSCDLCGGGTNVLPVFGEWEKSWPKPLLGTIYFVGLMWTFLGVSIVCDQFMGAIEEITSAERVQWRFIRNGAKHKFRVKVWNATVANLTLMALGSSAPEILLSVIEICTNRFFAGKLGPSTIVGSAAFNLLVITAVCIAAIPAPETRCIEGTAVFSVTATFSVLAYAWLLVILLASSPDRVESWEALVTLAMFPVLCLAAFAADKGVWRRLLPGEARGPGGQPLSWIEEETNSIQERYGKELPAETLAFMLQQRSNASQASSASRAHIRANIMRGFLGGKPPSGAAGSAEALLGFAEAETTVLECAGTIQLRVVASRPPGRPVELAYCTEEGTAREGVRYRRAEGVLRFEAGTTERCIEVQIVDDDSWQADESFAVRLGDLVQPVTPRPGLPAVRLGVVRTRINVLNDDMPGTLSFDVDEAYTHEGMCVTLGVIRTQGTVGRISCRYMTVDGAAVAGRDFEECSGDLVFEDGEMIKTIEVPILQSESHEVEDDERFRVVLCEPSPGVKFGGTTDENGAEASCEVVIIAAKEPPFWARLMRRCMNRDLLLRHYSEWLGQFAAAFYCNGCPEEQAGAGPLEWLLHVASLPWKLIFAFVPPPCFCGGWLCFVGALTMIGGVTLFVSELATLLGCCMRIDDEITAITLVALGTSLPDTVASKLAAQQDPTADNSIGNVTGSNSVNVFLGLGLPWTIAAFYWESQGPTPEWREHLYSGISYEERFLAAYPEGGFMVPAGATLAFSVAVFTTCALTCIGVLVARRLVYGGELGGPRRAQLRDAGVLVLLWVGYVAASSVNSSLSAA